MNAALLDRVSRLLATTPSRRTALAGLGGAFAALLTGSLPAAAKPKARRCRRGKKPCHGGCISRRKQCRKPGGKPCPAGKQRCQDRCISTTACCGGCPPGQLCDNGTCTPPRCRHGGPCRVFVTSQNFNGNLDGLEGGDAKCQAAANASVLTRGGTYKAWLSDATATPNTRFTNTASTGPYVRVDGQVIATDYAALTSQNLQVPITLTEQGDSRTGGAWTATERDGISTGRDCRSWISSEIADEGTGGLIGTTDGNWAHGFGEGCNAAFPLYCFEQG